MALATQDFNDLSKGFTTEASPLTFPEKFTVDEDNCIIAGDGSRQRRLGLTNVSTLSHTLYELHTTYSYVWSSPAGQSDREFLVVYNHGTLNIYKNIQDVYDNVVAAKEYVYTNEGETTLPGIPTSANAVEYENVSISDIYGYLLVGVQGQKPVVITYNPDDDTFRRTEVVPFIRDFYGVKPFDTYRRYNLINKGWIGDGALVEDTGTTEEEQQEQEEDVDLVSTFGFGSLPEEEEEEDLLFASIVSSINKQSTVSSSPGLEKYPEIIKAEGTHTDYYSVIKREKTGHVDQISAFTNTMGRQPDKFDIYALGLRADVDSGNFSFNKNEYQQNMIGTTEKANGKFFFPVNSFKRSIFADAPNFSFRAPSVVGAFAGRAWFATSDADYDSAADFSTAGAVFFSQIVEGLDKIPRCFQEADPTSDEINDLIASDGGLITISGCGPILALEAMMESLVVFAKNGVWEIKGGSGGFSATDYQVNKISDKGALSAQSVVSLGNALSYTSFSGMHVVTYNDNGILVEQDISTPVIKTFWNAIPDNCKKLASIFYDDENAEVRVMYSDDLDNPNKKNKEVIYSLRYEALTKNSYNLGSGFLNCYLKNPRNTSGEVEESITTVDGEVITTEAGENVTINAYKSFSKEIATMVLVTNPASPTEMVFCELKDTSYKDFGVYNYVSYLISGYSNFGDSMRNKQLVYITTNFYKTETGFEIEDGVLDLVDQSSCLVQVRWDYHNTAAGNRWSPSFQGYRFRRHYTPSGAGDTFDTGELVVSSKNKVRGFGHALAIKFTSEEGKDFRLLGWGMLVEGRGTV